MCSAKVAAWDEGEKVTYDIGNSIIDEIVVPKGNERGSIAIRTQDLMLDATNAASHGLPERIVAALEAVPGIEEVKAVPIGSSSGARLFMVTRGTDFNMQAMLEALGQLPHPSKHRNEPIIGAEEIEQVIQAKPQRRTTINPFRAGN